MDEVPAEVKAAQKELREQALIQKLKDIDMTQHDATVYSQYVSSVQREIREIRVMLEALEAKKNERVWLKNQSSGDLDDTKLIEGITGERAIYKRRGEIPPEMGSFQELPKRLNFVFDLSASMTRFNGFDGRLDRSMEAATMIMESFKNFDHKFKYSLTGHSGDSSSMPFVKEDQYPKNEKERLAVVKRMTAHANYCLSGDSTLQGIELAIREIVKEPADEYFVMILSDANLDQYNIKPADIAKALKADERVNAYILFIGTIRDQAEKLMRSLPAGHAFVCLDTKDIPKVMQRIFTSTMLKV